MEGGGSVKRGISGEEWEKGGREGGRQVGRINRHGRRGRGKSVKKGGRRRKE